MGCWLDKSGSPGLFAPCGSGGNGLRMQATAATMDSPALGLGTPALDNIPPMPKGTGEMGDQVGVGSRSLMYDIGTLGESAVFVASSQHR